MKRIVVIMIMAVAMAMATGAATHGMTSKVKWRGASGSIYRVTLRDKQGTPFSPDRPREFLSRKAVERRRRQGLAVDSTDLPVSPVYLRMLADGGVRVLCTSRWQNSALVYTPDTALMAPLRRLACVRECRRVWQSPDSVSREQHDMRYSETFNKWDTIASSAYGAAEEQIRTLNGIRLHEEGYDGRGMTIAVLDGGFLNADRIPALSAIDVRGVRDFVCTADDGGDGKKGARRPLRDTDHGTKVLSAMGTRAPHVYIGTAPGAAYWLLRCEDRQTEQPVEEDYWTMAAEFADSAGVDIINSSLGYNEFDNHIGDHRIGELDGRSAFISRSASMLADKGIVLVCSAGNSGMGQWKKITFPADATDILTVGAVTPQLCNAPFCGVGPTQDGRVKPDVMAPGSPASVISGRGAVVQDMGTSFATPIVCGLVACLWQARPWLTAREIIEAVRRSADNHAAPDNIFGYGIPDFGRALDEGRHEVSPKGRAALHEKRKTDEQR